MEGEFAAGGGRVDLLLKALEADLSGGQIPDRFDQVGQRPSQPVEFPHDQGVARATHLQGFGQAGPFRPGPAGRIVADPLAPRRQQGVLLQVGPNPPKLSAGAIWLKPSYLLSL